MKPSHRNDRAPEDETVFGVEGARKFLGEEEWSVKSIYHHVARKQIPFRRLGRKLIFLKSELQQYTKTLPGCTLEEVLKNGRD